MRYSDFLLQCYWFFIMITKRIIPCLDVDQGRVVKGVNFVDIRDAGTIELAKKYAADGADELVFLDITASSDKRLILRDMVQQVALKFLFHSLLGGINSIEMIQDIGPLKTRYL